MKAQYFTTPNGLNLLTEWDGENHDPEIYAANVARARAAVYRFRNRGGLIFGGSRMPRTNAEFFNNMPYTSSSNFAAIWADCEYQILKIADRSLHLDGFALTDADAVAVWTRYDDNGKEVETVYEVIER